MIFRTSTHKVPGLGKFNYMSLTADAGCSLLVVPLSSLIWAILRKFSRPSHGLLWYVGLFYIFRVDCAAICQQLPPDLETDPQLHDDVPVSGSPTLGVDKQKNGTKLSGSCRRKGRLATSKMRRAVVHPAPAANAVKMLFECSAKVPGTWLKYGLSLVREVVVVDSAEAPKDFLGEALGPEHGLNAALQREPQQRKHRKHQTREKASWDGLGGQVE